ncbi:Helix-turn-helix domain-containing protein [Microlunatus soli]|uniref:Helix-turn-helix domain-containing protein n=1 Tax=Microlunatus soli TaxID=630515 RepID=A0A1H1V9J6_9ACTN|nr:Helix-turn-helix domain-containing protein [Microlunatus soli]
MEARQALGAFLRSRRDRLSPAAAGIVSTGRRRAPGLRREEVAQLAGVGVTWYTWLEQGRDVHPSESVTRAIGRALQLDCDETAYLLALTGYPRRLDLLARAEILPGHLELLERMLPNPVCIHDARFDFYAYNRSYRFLVSDLNAIPEADRNYASLFFTDDGWRSRFGDRDTLGQSLVGRIRSRIAHQPGDPSWQELITSLRDRSTEFRRIWQGQIVTDVQEMIKVIDNPLVGELRLELSRLPLGETSGSRIGMLTAADPQTTDRLAELDRLVGDEPAVWVRDAEAVDPATTERLDRSA